MAIAPIAKLRGQLLRRPAGTIGLVFSTKGFTQPAVFLAHFTMPQAVLLWSQFDIDYALRQESFAKVLRRKYLVCCETGVPDCNVRTEEIL